MKYKRLNAKDALALCADLDAAPKGTRLIFDHPLHLKATSEGQKVFSLGNDFLFSGEEASAINAGIAHIEVPEPEPFHIPLCPKFKNLGERLPTAVEWEYEGYSYTIHQNGSVIINGLDRGGFYRTIMSAHGNETLAANVYSIAKRIHDLAHRAHPFAVALDLEMFIESLTAEDDKSAIFVSADELLSDPSKEPNPFIKAMEAIQELKPADPFAHPAFEGWRRMSFGIASGPTNSYPFCTMTHDGKVAFSGYHQSGEYGTLLPVPRDSNAAIVPHLGTIAGMFNSLLAADVSHPTIAGTVKAFIESVTKEAEASNP